MLTGQATVTGAPSSVFSKHGEMCKAWGPRIVSDLKYSYLPVHSLKLALAAVQTRIAGDTLVGSGKLLPVLLDKGKRLLKGSFKVMQELKMSVEGVHGIINDHKGSLDKTYELIQEQQVSLEGDLIHMGDLDPPLQGSFDLVRGSKQCHSTEESHGSPERGHGPALIEDQPGLRDSPRPMLAQDWVTEAVHGSGSQHLEGALVGSTEAMGEPSQACKNVYVGLAGLLDKQENPLLERSISETLENIRKEYRHFETLEMCMEGTQIQIPGSCSNLKEQDCAVVLGHGKRELNDVPNVESTEPLNELQKNLAEEQGSLQNVNGTIVASDGPVGKLDISLENTSFDQEECCTRVRPFPMEVSPMSLEWHMGSDWSTKDSPLPTVAIPELNCQEAARTEADILYLEPSVSAVLQDTGKSREDGPIPFLLPALMYLPIGSDWSVREKPSHRNFVKLSYVQYNTNSPDTKTHFQLE